MKLSDLNFSFDESLIATVPHRPTRVMWVQDQNFSEMTKAQLLEKFQAGDVLVVNNTKVIPRRIFAQSSARLEPLEVLFLKELDKTHWEVLFPSSRLKKEEHLLLPQGVKAFLEKGGIPQVVKVSQALPLAYFEMYGEMPLPPYIQKARSSRHSIKEDERWYQTAWAKFTGSSAAPTASLHFDKEDLQKLKTRGVLVEEITLHVGMGTFLPVTTENLNDHKMHFEWARVPESVWKVVLDAKKNGHHIWALGTTVARSLESCAHGLLNLSEDSSEDSSGTMSYGGETNLFIRPGFEFLVVDRLLTNFHQPQSTLLALVAAFTDLNTVLSAYKWAIEKRFQLFSYGDLTVWLK